MAGVESPDAHACAAPAAEMLQVTVFCSPAARVTDVVELTLPAGSTAALAVQRSGLLLKYPALAADESLVCALWGRAVPPQTTLLRDGDRLALCRGLQVDPKEARRQRYRAQGDRAHQPRRRRRASGSASPAAEAPPPLSGSRS